MNRHQERRQQRERARRRRTVLLAALGLGLVGVLALAGYLASGAGRGGSAQGSSAGVNWSAPAYSGGPRLAVDRTTVDDGTVPYGHEVEATYRLKNVGDQALTLRQPAVEALEGC